MIYPDYSRNQCAIASEVLKRFGINYGKSSLGLLSQKNKKLSIVVVDGLGWNLFSRLKLPSDVYALKTTSVFPSTTASSLASLSTGLTPGSHGIIGYRAFFKETGSIIKPLEFTYASSHINEALARISRLTDLVKFKTSFEILKKKRIRSAVLLPEQLVGSSYSNLIFSGVTQMIGYSNIWDALFLYSKLLDNPKVRLVHLYLPYIDSLEHAYGEDGRPAFDAAVYVLDKLIHIQKSRAKYASTVITADHGHINLGKRINLRSDKALMDKLELPPYGDGRAPLFRSRSDLTMQLSRYNLKVFGKKDAHTLLGQIDREVSKNMPDFIGIPSDDSYYEYDFNTLKGRKKALMKSNHGGLSEDEMEIPLLTLD
jgi:hypothetical protein